VGYGKKGDVFWEQIQGTFFDLMGKGIYRTPDQITSKWRDMRLKINFFNGIYNNLENLN